MKRTQRFLQGISVILAVVMLIQLSIHGLAIAANMQNAASTAYFTKVGNTTVYTHGYNVSAKELASRGWLFVTDANGILYKKAYDKSTETTDDVFFSLPPDCHLKFKPNSVYFNADGLLYLNTPEGNQLYSVIPNNLWDFEVYIQEQQLILDEAVKINATRVQETAKERIEAYCQAERAIFTETFRQQNNIRYLAHRENISQTPKPIVKEIQVCLSALGYTSSNANGYYDWITWNNVAHFQIINGLDATGHLDEKTYELIMQKRTEAKGKGIIRGKIFKMGQPEDILSNELYDEYYKYDPNAQANAGDYAKWALWGEAEVAAYLMNFPDAAPQYSHYRDATGTDRNIDFQKAYNEDQLYKAFIDNLVIDAQLDSETIRSQINRDSFSMTTMVKYKIPNGFNENWQKALGAILTWASANVSYNNGTYTATINVHVKDRYNFNRNAADIVTGVPDNANGRFAVLGWAKSFFSYGNLTKTVTWSEGEIPDYISIPGYDRSRENADRASRRTR